MSFASRVAIGGALLVVAAAPAAAQGATTRADLRATGLLTNSNSVQAGQSFTAFGLIQNRAGRRSSTGRATFSLRTSRTARSGRALGALTLKRIKGGAGRLFTIPLVTSGSQAAGNYFLSVCVKQPGRTKAKCRTSPLKVTTRPAPPVPAPTPADNRPPQEKLRTAVTTEGMFKHLKAFQDIAAANGGNRASGFPGYDASAQYVMEQLSAAGYSPTTQPFDFVVFTETAAPLFNQITPTATTYEPDDDEDATDVDFLTMEYSAPGDTGTRTLQAVDVNLNATPANRISTSGCEDADFTGFGSGNVALLQRGGCNFDVKVYNAQEAGASGVVMFNQGNEPGGRTDVFAGTLAETAQDGDAPDVTIPAIGISYPLGEELATGAAKTVRVRVEATNIERSTLNVLADTPTGNPNTTIVQGSHLDSVQEGPGINDNGSGSAYNLESAIQLAKLGIKPANRVRFAFWGAEESGLVGATRYIAAISDEEFAKLKMNLNFDMLASPNFARLIYDGDFSDTLPPATAPDVNPGAAEIEQKFKAYFDSQHLASLPTGFDGRSDYKPFQDNGIAAGGLFTGAEDAKTAGEQAMFGGISNVAFDPNYHGVGDTLANINPNGFEQMSDAAAFVMGSYATDAGFPARFEAAQSGPSVRQGATSVRRAGTGVKSERLGRFLQR